MLVRNEFEVGGFDFSKTFGIRDGVSDAFDGGGRVKINGKVVNAHSYIVTEDGNHARVPEQRLGNVMVSREISLVQKGVVRILDEIRNVGPNFEVVKFERFTNLGSDGLTRMEGSSNGKNVGFSSITTDDNVRGGRDPAVAHVYDAVLDPDLFTYLERDYVSAVKNVKIASGETQVYATFIVQDFSPDKAIEMVRDIEAGKPGFLDNISLENLANLQNWNVPLRETQNHSNSVILEKQMSSISKGTVNRDEFVFNFDNKTPQLHKIKFFDFSKDGIKLQMEEEDPQLEWVERVGHDDSRILSISQEHFIVFEEYVGEFSEDIFYFN